LVDGFFLRASWSSFGDTRYDEKETWRLWLCDRSWGGVDMVGRTSRVGEGIEDRKAAKAIVAGGDSGDYM
jgi:hypothetical protein